MNPLKERMSRSQIVAALAMTVLTGIGIYCFFALQYPYHLHFQEQYQLFECTWPYFASVAGIPGGLADWLGRFVTQFFYYAPLGAVLLALLLCGVQLLCWAACRRKTLPVYALSFLPVAFLLAFYCDEGALAGAAFALALSLAGVAVCQRIPADRPRQIVELVLLPLLYMACGGLAVVFVLICIIREVSCCRGKAWMFAAVSFVLCLLTPIAASRLFPYPLGRLLSGVHYYRYFNLVPVMLWLSALCAVAVALLSCLKVSRPKIGWLTGSALFAVMAALGVFLTSRAADPVKEEWMCYDFMVRMQMWNRIMLKADKKNPDNPKTVSCLNLALSKTGRMADSQFQYFQNGPEGLLPDFTGDYTNPVSTAEIYWHLGMVNTAQRFAFEAQEAIPDFQKSVRCYKRLAETNMVNGDREVARKYLKALSNTLFYRKWACETAALLDSGQIFEKRPELARVRDFRLQKHDFLFSNMEMDSMLGLLKVEHPENTMALDYMMSWCLLRKDLDRFVQLISMVDAPAMPKSYQEALLLRWVLTHSDFSGLPDYLAPAYAQRMNRFLADIKANKPEAQMFKLYGDTYWFYYYFRYRN